MLVAKVQQNEVDPPFTAEYLVAKIDHTLLAIHATPSDVERTCAEAIEHEFFAVCVRPAFVAQAAKLLKGSKSIPISVVGFPETAGSRDWPTELKRQDTELALRAGAREIDMVIHLTAFRERDFKTALEDIQAIVKDAGSVPVKVILETSLLTPEQIVAACALVKATDAQFVKTSTGFRTGGAKTEDVTLMRKVVGNDFGVKASGGIKTLQNAKDMINAGANRIGCSASVQILKELKTQLDDYAKRPL